MEAHNIALKVETFRSGVFSFQAGVDLAALQPLMDRVEDAHRRFSSIPILPDVAAQLEQEVLVSSVFGTNTIEGGTLSEEETAQVLETPEVARDEKDVRVLNISRAYGIAETFADHCLADLSFPKSGTGFAVPLEGYMVKDLHEEVTQGLSHPYNIPGEYRDNGKGQRTQVGDAAHGGVYTPPKCREDVELLMGKFMEWANSPPIVALSPLIRAPLVHYYFERIHPFWDGNGRVGRVLEAMVLKCAGYSYAPFALSRYYLDNIDSYFAAFNQARKAEDKKESYPNQGFVELFLRGMLDAFNRLHDRVNRMIGFILYRDRVRWMYEEKTINLRQYTIVTHLLAEGASQDLAKLKAQPWFKAMYAKLTPMTQSRDLRGLVDKKLAAIAEGKLRLLIP